MKKILILIFLLLVSQTQAQPPTSDSSPQQLFNQALEQSRRGNSARAVELLDQAIAAAPNQPAPYRWRGREQFRLGKVEASLADFDRFVELAPEAEKTLWERGITHYYVKKFDEGAKQFELYQTYHDADVENAVWRYLCVARRDGVDAARRSLLTIRNDRRVPMMSIYDLYRGKLTPDQVLAGAKLGEPDKPQLNQQLFYAHLYIGLHYEAAGNAAKAKEYITKAADEYRISHYMGDVAHVHAQRLRQQ